MHTFGCILNLTGRFAPDAHGCSSSSTVTEMAQVCLSFSISCFALHIPLTVLLDLLMLIQCGLGLYEAAVVVSVRTMQKDV